MSLLLFGSTSSIGNAVSELAAKNKKNIIGIGRKSAGSKPDNLTSYVEYDIENQETVDNLNNLPKVNKVVFCQGINCNDSVYNFNPEQMLEMFKVNCLYIPFTINKLMLLNKLDNNTRIVVVSSIWQDIARQNKLSYTITKAALSGLVRQVAVDLAKDGHAINAVLPGVLETPMTRNNLSAEQIDNVEGATLSKKLASIDDVAKVILDLCNIPISVTGQMINVDYGFSYTKIL